MLSAVILSERGYPAVPLVGQLVDQRFVRPGPLVLGTGFLKLLTRAADRDRTVSRRSKPSSRAALMGEQPNPWDLLQPQDATSRHRTFIRRFRRRRLCLLPARPKARGRRVVTSRICSYRAGSSPRPFGLSRYGVMRSLIKWPSLLRRLPTALPFLCAQSRAQRDSWCKEGGVRRYKPML